MTSERSLSRSILLAVLTAAPAMATESGLVPAPAVSIPKYGWKEAAYRVHSKVLGADVELYVSTPPSYGSTTRRYPLFVLLDGEYYDPILAACAAELADTGAIPEAVLVAIRGMDRRADFTPNSMSIPGIGKEARGDDYVRFLADELVPVLESSLRVATPRVLIGHSHGGILATHACASRPDVFSWILALDAPMQLDDSWLARHVIERAKANPKLPLRFVSIEKKFGFSDEDWSAFEEVAPEGSVLVRDRLDDERHESLVMPGILRGLKRLFRDFSAVEWENDEGSVGFIARYERVAERYGAPIPPPVGELRRTLDDAIAESDRAAAKKLLAWSIDGFGAPDDLEKLQARIAAIQDAPTETVASMLATPRPKPEEIAEYLGEWSGEIWLEDTPHHPLHVTIEAQGERTGGRILEGGDPRAPVMELTYLRKRDDGVFEFGFQNGMRPRGMLVFEGRLKDGRLAGEERLRGMKFVRPDGSPPFVFGFSLVRDDAKSK